MQNYKARIGRIDIFFLNLFMRLKMILNDDKRCYTVKKFQTWYWDGIGTVTGQNQFLLLLKIKTNVKNRVFIQKNSLYRLNII